MNTPRTVVINERAEPAVAVPFTDEDAAKAYLIPLLEAALVAEDLRDEYAADLSTLSLAELGEIDSGLMVIEEGTLGVWAGFSSSDRCSICGPFPYDEHEWTGNGDPNEYLTVGQPTGVPVLATPDMAEDFE